ncbi:hypothetical protein [Streptomyces sp. WAC01280]|uniref:hypothetical protein n=1 Tax=Streptomyces sp. WAC01280 TaxID=2487424 RepID=UPI000F7B3B3A|nr:hypothetical protein [Streptomyces sp. WAC01280]RSS52596.1 hypothetical protein EF909_30045 [Streptomyces sp. WAC01280]
MISSSSLLVLPRHVPAQPSGSRPLRGGAAGVVDGELFSSRVDDEEGAALGGVDGVDPVG